jgi:dipeptidyl aminopeptidase/acylaminoacyl peptidase
MGTQSDDRRRLESRRRSRADRVQRPLLVIHGFDSNVRKQSPTDGRGNRREGKDVEYFVLYDEGHGGFGNPTSAVQMFPVVEGFARHGRPERL